MDFVNKKLLLVLSKLPVLGPRYQRRLTEATVGELELIRERFFKNNVHFKDQIHDLYDCLKGFDLPAKFVPRQYLRLPITLKVKSSLGGVELFEMLLNGQEPYAPGYFDSGGVGFDSLLDWCSNEETLTTFINLSVKLLEVHCARSLEQAAVITGNAGTTLDIPTGLDEFLSSVLFKYLVKDLIEVVLLLLGVYLGELDGQGTA